MQTWRESMPQGMLLRSAWEETSLSAPGGRGSLGEWARANAQPRVEPIPLEAFLRYSDWFTQQFVGEHDDAEVAKIEDTEDGTFRLTDEPRRHVRGGSRCTRGWRDAVPARARRAPRVVGSRSRARHARTELETLRDQEVAVVGGGQSALETAGLAAQAGAKSS